MAKYQQDVQTLLEKIGGKGNIQAVSHCMTRMRFVLVDPKKAGLGIAPPYHPPEHALWGGSCHPPYGKGKPLRRFHPAV